MEKLVQERLDFASLVKGYEDNGAYRVYLAEFCGPVDLLLILIKQTKIDPKKVFVSEITEKFLAYMSSVQDMDIETIADFLTVAVQLLEYKSRLLLPCGKLDGDDSNLMSEKEQLLKMILEEKKEEFSMLRDKSEILSQTQQSNRMYKEADQSTTNVISVFKEMTIDSMINAYVSMFAKLSQKEYDKTVKKEIKKEKFTVAEKLLFLRSVLNKKKEVKLSELFEHSFSKGELIATFQAILEMLKLQEIVAEQKHIYDDILIKKFN